MTDNLEKVVGSTWSNMEVPILGKFVGLASPLEGVECQQLDSGVMMDCTKNQQSFRRDWTDLGAHYTGCSCSTGCCCDVVCWRIVCDCCEADPDGTSKGVVSFTDTVNEDWDANRDD